MQNNVQVWSRKAKIFCRLPQKILLGLSLLLLYRISEASYYISLSTHFEAVNATTYFNVSQKKTVVGFISLLSAFDCFFCPRVVFTSETGFEKGVEDIHLYFCPHETGILLKNTSEIINVQPVKFAHNDRYQSVWFTVDKAKGVIEFGGNHTNKVIASYNYGAYFNNNSYITHFGFAGAARWILDSDKPDIIAKTFDKNVSNTYFPLRTDQFYFAIKPQLNHCPTLQFVPNVGHHENSVQVKFCLGEIGITQEGELLKKVQVGTIQGVFKGFWLQLDQILRVVTVGIYGDRTVILQHEYSPGENNPFFSYYILHGGADWVVETSKPNLGKIVTISKSNDTVVCDLNCGYTNTQNTRLNSSTTAETIISDTSPTPITTTTPDTSPTPITTTTPAAGK